MVLRMSISSKSLNSHVDGFLEARALSGMRVQATGRTVSTAVALALCLASGHVAAQADDAPAFDRPGIPFSAEVLQPGGFAWEQGLPDASTDRSDGQRTSQYTADTLLRLGLFQNVELQLGSDSYNWQHGGGARVRGGGDSSIGLKVVLPSRSDSFHWAALGTYSVPTGSPAFSEGYSRELGVTASWDLPEQRAIAMYVNYARDDEGHTWTFAPNYTFFSGDHFSSYVEAGFDTGSEHSRVAGAGGAWQLPHAMQLDVSVLRGLTSESPDWQGGIGVSIAFE
ncbi:TPA: transporter [Xanthomonas vasicola pv. zeae]|nr:transporter [Xanthomonas vasicola]MBV6745681.1 transporter [Xanthomonas vasicola pv. vasculorum NCPPB 890]MBV6891046.1 transporter [Xanthomonas vasicola pv. vasculorum]MBV7305417.1 transporter [Xanthomonas vasicola pv. vasculorum]MDO6934404.1 transporter [Xanthomonas vasicola]MDO6937946.1 transporter [Xanthomonas vasicola]